VTAHAQRGLARLFGFLIALGDPGEEIRVEVDRRGIATITCEGRVEGRLRGSYQKFHPDSLAVLDEVNAERVIRELLAQVRPPVEG